MDESRRKFIGTMSLLGLAAAGAGAGGLKSMLSKETQPNEAGDAAPNGPPHFNTTHVDITKPPYNAKADGVTDDSKAFSKAMDDATDDGFKVYVPKGKYFIRSGFVVTQPNVILEGSGQLILGNRILLAASHFRCAGLRFKALNTSDQIRCFLAETKDVGKELKHFTIENCEFEDFFYSTDFRGTEAFMIHDIVVTNCRSTAPEFRNAGHFQNVYTVNSYYAGNQCYNGQNATSYNFFGGNGKIKIIGNYDQNNSYGSCEIENSPGAEVIITGNNFDRQLWIDDSSTVIIAGNIVKERIFITVQDDDCDKVIITNNITDRIYVDKFGDYVEGKVRRLEVSHNIFTGPGSYGVFIRGDYAEKCRIKDNQFVPDVFDNGAVGIVRADGLDVEIADNDLNGRIVCSSEGGEVNLYGNKNYTLSGTIATTVMERFFHSGSSSLQVGAVKFVQSQQMSIEPEADAELQFMLDSIPGQSAAVHRVTILSRCKNSDSSSTFNAIEQTILIVNDAGHAEVSAGEAHRVLSGPASDVNVAYDCNADGSILNLTVHNLSTAPMLMRASIEAYDPL